MKFSFFYGALLISLLLARFGATSVLAQEKEQSPVAMPSQDVVYSRFLPPLVKKRMPRRAQSCFFGFFRPAPNSKELALHLYNSHVSKELKPALTEGSYHFTVDLFEVGYTQRKKHKTYHFLRTFALNYKGMPWPPNKFGVRFYWLDSKQTVPLLVFNNFALGETSLAVGDKVSAVFVQSWMHAPHIQSFLYDDGAGSGAVSTRGVEIARALDESGQVQIVISDWSPPSGPTHNQYYRWNGQKFVSSHEETVEQPQLEP